MKKVKQVLSGGGSKRPKPVSSFGGSSSVPKPKKKSKLKKFGKYAVAGLAGKIYTDIFLLSQVLSIRLKQIEVGGNCYIQLQN